MAKETEDYRTSNIKLRDKLGKEGFPYNVSSQVIRSRIQDISFWLTQSIHPAEKEQLLLMMMMGMNELRERSNQKLTIAILALSLLTAFTAIISVFDILVNNWFWFLVDLIF